tara:strand:- start:34 stop:387 length:354 start_codon:yes stop_codon:yes gene_type:complete
MKFAALLLLFTFSLSCALHAQLRVHRIDKLGEGSLSSPSFDHTEARAEASVVFPELANEQGWDFTQSSDSERFTDEGLAPKIICLSLTIRCTVERPHHLAAILNCRLLGCYSSKVCL